MKNTQFLFSFHRTRKRRFFILKGISVSICRRMLKVGTAVAVKPASSICKRIIIRVVTSVSVPGFQTDVRAPTGPMAM